MGASAPRVTKGVPKKRRKRKGKGKKRRKKEGKERKKERKRYSNMANRAPFKHKQGRPGGAPGKNFRGAKLTAGGG